MGIADASVQQRGSRAGGEGRLERGVLERPLSDSG
jgi:hypothetical protein